MPRTTKTDNDGKTYELMRFIVRCNICKDVLESKTAEDDITCVCKNLTIRGGVEADKFIACIHDLIIDLSEWKLIK
jgi:hypothetical protein